MAGRLRDMAVVDEKWQESAYGAVNNLLFACGHQRSVCQ